MFVLDSHITADHGGRNGGKGMEDAAHWLAGSAFVHTQDFLPSGSTIHSGLNPPKSIINQENARSCLQDNLKEAFSLLRFCFLKQL